MKIEAGKFYRSRDGRKVGPMRPLPPDHDTGEAWEGHFPGEVTRTFYANGRWLGSHQQTERDLVSEWADEPTGPVITETVKRIKPGVYSRVQVAVHPTGKVIIGLTNRLGESIDRGNFDFLELRAAAATLLEIADALVKP